MHGTVHLFEHLPQVDETPVSADVHHLAPAVRTKPLVGLIRNPRSHGNAGREVKREVAREAMHKAGRDTPENLAENILVETPRKRGELTGILTRFAKERVDFIAIDGGDGTVRDVLTLGTGIFGSSWPTLILLPTGKTNALGHDLGVPNNWSIEDALKAAKAGSISTRQPILVSQRDDERSKVLGFALGAGAFTRGIALGQRGHNLGAFNKVIVGLTVVWSTLQSFFGRANNPWRRGTKMIVRDGKGKELTHLGGLPEDERYLLFASSLRSFPLKLDPFRGIEETVRVAVMDNASRGMLLRLGAIFTGRGSDETKARGYHVFGEKAVELDLGDAFILDGEAFPPGQYRMSAGPTLRFVVP